LLQNNWKHIIKFKKILKSSNLSLFLCSVISLSYIFSPVLLIHILPGADMHVSGKGWPWRTSFDCHPPWAPACYI